MKFHRVLSSPWVNTVNSNVGWHKHWRTVIGSILGIVVIPTVLFAEDPSVELIVTVPDDVRLGAVPLNYTERAQLLGPIHTSMLVSVKRGEVPRFQKDLLQHVPGSSVQMNFRYRAQMVPNDPSYTLQWHLGAIKMPDAWDFDITDPLYGGSPSIVVAVLDTGISYEDYQAYAKAPDFNQTSFVQGTDLVNNDDHPNDDNGHGTHVTMTIAQSTNNALSGSGIAFNTSIMPVKVLDTAGDGSTATIAAGIEYARTHGAHIINLSLGGIDNDPLVHTAIQQASAAGIIVVSATGNSGQSSIFYPAKYDEVIAVGATRFDGARAPYANYGDGIDMVAPGGDLDVDQNGDGQWDGILQQTCTTVACAAFSDYYYEGTSQAVPQVSAAAALLLASGIPAAQITGLLEGSSNDLGSAGYDTSFGWGQLDVQRALYTGKNDTVAPEGSVVINAGSTLVQGNSVTLTLSASDTGTGVSSMSFSGNGSTFSPWEAYGTTKLWDLSTYGGTVADGAKSVFVRYRDAAGNSASPVASSIIVDTVKPTKPSITATAPSPYHAVMIVSGVPTSVSAFSATWTAGSDSNGIMGYRMVYDTDMTRSIQATELMTDRVFSAPPIEHVTTKFLRIVAYDNAGNASDESVFTFVYRPLRIVTVANSGLGLMTIATSKGKILKKIFPYTSTFSGGLSTTSMTFELSRSQYIAVSALHASKPIRIYSSEGVKRKEFSPFGKKKVPGVHLASGDTDNDGIDELIVSPSAGAFPTLIVSTEGKVIKEFYPFGTAYRDGSAAMTYHYQGKTYIGVAKQSADPSVTIFTASGKKTGMFNAFPPQSKHSVAIASGDIDGDGNDELIASQKNGSSLVRVFNGKRKLIKQFYALSKSFSGGLFVATGDTDGDGRASILTVPARGGAQIGVFDQRGKNSTRFFSMSKTVTTGFSITGTL